MCIGSRQPTARDLADCARVRSSRAISPIAHQSASANPTANPLTKSAAVRLQIRLQSDCKSTSLFAYKHACKYDCKCACRYATDMHALLLLPPMRIREGYMACNLLHSVEHMQRNVGGCLHRHFVHAEYRLMHMYFPFTVAFTFVSPIRTLLPAYILAASCVQFISVHCFSLSEFRRMRSRLVVWNVLIGFCVSKNSNIWRQALASP